MNSRERVSAAIHHRQPDRAPLDLGSTGQTGINACALHRFRRHLGLEDRSIAVCEMYQMLGRVDEDLMQLLGVDVIGLNGRYNMFGVPDGEMTPFTMSDGTPVTFSRHNALDVNADGSVIIYPQGDRSAQPSGYMPPNGYFFDNLVRGGDFDEDNLTPAEDFEDAFSVIKEEDALYFDRESRRLFEMTQYGIIGNLGGAGLGDAAWIPGPNEKTPRGIRRMEDWLMAHLLYPDYIRAVFEMQTQVMLKNLEIYRQAVGDRIQIVWISGTDFGTQHSSFFGRDVFNALYKPFYRKINDWVHEHTPWKTFYHTCGCVVDLLDDFVDMGVDILNPLQLSAAGMNGRMLKEKYGDRLVFWGGGIDTQKTLPFGGAQEIARQVRERLDILAPGGGYVFNTIHNIVGDVPAANLLAMYNAYRAYYGLEEIGK